MRGGLMAGITEFTPGGEPSWEQYAQSHKAEQDPKFAKEGKPSFELRSRISKTSPSD